MWIKVAILILLLALLISLGSGLFFLIKDRGNSRRTLNSLGVRISVAVALLALIAYGLSTGQIGNRAPWDVALEKKRHAQTAGTPEEAAGIPVKAPGVSDAASGVSNAATGISEDVNKQE